MERQDYSFLFDPPKESDVFTRVLYYPRSPPSPALGPQTPSTTSSTKATTSIPSVVADAPSALGDNHHAATLSKFKTGFLSSNSAASETVTPFLNEHIPGHVHAPDNRPKQKSSDERTKVYCYRHQPDRRCTRRTPQEDTVAEIQKVNTHSLIILSHILICRQWTYCR